MEEKTIEATIKFGILLQAEDSVRRLQKELAVLVRQMPDKERDKYYTITERMRGELGL